MVLKLKTSSRRLPVHVHRGFRLAVQQQVRAACSQSARASHTEVIESGWISASDTSGNATTPALKSTAAVQAPRLRL